MTKSQAKPQDKVLLCFWVACTDPTKPQIVGSDPPLPASCPLEKPQFINYRPFHFLQGFWWETWGCGHQVEATLSIYELVVWLPRGMRDEAADGPALLLIKPTTPYLLNKHHFIAMLIFIGCFPCATHSARCSPAQHCIPQFLPQPQGRRTSASLFCG